MNLHGIGLVDMGQQISVKYDFEFPLESIEKNVIRLTNQIWKLIPMRENDEDWARQLETVKIEIAGLNEIFIQDPRFLQLLSKLEGLQIEKDIDFPVYRKTVFEAISLLQECKHGKKT